ncbi:MAG: hypothetical protein ACM3X0_13310, partial [Bacteroidota bacterium]
MALAARYLSLKNKVGLPGAYRREANLAIIFPGTGDGCAKQKAPLAIANGALHGEPGGDLLSRAEAHYHRRFAVSRSC